MSKGSDSNLNFLKTQTCVLKVNICCDGCKIKVKKLLQKIDGVYTINIDSEKGKVTVSGSASPATLIKKLCKAGKHAELLGPRSGNSNSTSNNFHEQLQKLQLHQKGNGNPTKNGAGGGGGGGGKEQKGQQLLQQMKGVQDLKMPQTKDQKKNAKFTFPSEDEEEDDDDMYDSEDGDDYDYDDEDLDGFEDDHKHSKKKPVKEKGGGGGKKESHGGGGGGGCGHKDGKNGGDKNKKGAPGGNGKDGNNGGKNKKGGGAAGGANNPTKMAMGGQGMQGTNTGTMGAPVGHPMNLSAGGMPPGYYQGGMAAAQQQQQQQQYMAAMQQRMMMNGPMHYGQQPMMGYSQPMGQMPPPPPAYGEPAYAHYFSDENPNSCTVM
ncbi:heavy metal-associated isoprenylated plant protein 32-like [Iris pallida]|uniref:Heavy metal-associated isoprenylated plant protein 32-like n=1 Tax=Iris pallida TaxID=29817 RepID=A0AAX6HN07_IRIPA|nr:heavy metal-associated isoprenylated plant protein 32-like [Iris pallida]